jgi:DNA-directed RNA polymerase specialized sigma24 family protein
VVSTLPADHQEVVRLQHFEGLADEEVAERLGVAVGTVKSRSFCAHHRLALELGHVRDGTPSPTPGRSQLQEAKR